VVLRADAAADAGLLSAAGVEAENQVVAVLALAVHVVNDRLHAVREVVLLRVGVAGRVALLGGPAVVEVKVAVAGVVCERHTRRRAEGASVTAHATSCVTRWQRRV
jgi:hypothetical protein